GSRGERLPSRSTSAPTVGPRRNAASLVGAASRYATALPSPESDGALDPLPTRLSRPVPSCRTWTSPPEGASPGTSAAGLTQAAVSAWAVPADEGAPTSCSV